MTFFPPIFQNLKSLYNVVSAVGTAADAGTVEKGNMSPFDHSQFKVKT